jgi:hypothetical protein
MKQHLFLLALLGIFLNASCKKDPKETQFSVFFHAQYDGKQADLAKNYSFSNTTDVQFTRFNIFLSDLALVKENGSLQSLSEIEFLDFTSPADATSLLEPIRIQFTAPVGKYKGLSLGYGVKPSLNAQKPNKFPSTHPLSIAAGEFWDSWGSYIFMKIEGRGEQDGDPDPEVNMVYHCGSDEVYRTGTKQIALDLQEGAADLHVAFDLKKLFYVNSEWFDIEGAPRTSDSKGDVKVAKLLMDQIDASVSIQ